MVPDWSALPADVIELISTLITTGANYVCFRSVCHSWRSAAPKKQQIPGIFVEFFAEESEHIAVELPNDIEPEDIVIEFRHLPSTEIVGPHLIRKGKTICGCSRGWIAFLDRGPSPAVSLHNPITEVNIHLPIVTDLPPTDDNYRLKVVLSSDPMNGNCVALAICYSFNSLIYCRPGDDSWTTLPLPGDTTDFTDIVFYEGRVYGVSRYNLFVCDTELDAQVTKISLADPSQHSYPHMSNYLVSTRDLLLVKRKSVNSIFTPYFFEVFKVDLANEQQRLLKLENLGGDALFFDSMYTSVYFQNSPWCRGNCIYFACSEWMLQRDYPEGVRRNSAIKVFDMEDNNYGFVLVRDFDSEFHWFTPSVFY